MPGVRYDTAREKSPVLVACAHDLYPFLSNELRDRIRIVQAVDFSGAHMAFNKEKPSLIICGLDENGQQFSPLIHTAARHNVPVLAVASTEKAAKIGGVKWVLDRRKVSAVVSLANKLLDDPTFVPNSPSKYPPPRTLEGNTKENEVIMVQPEIVSKKTNKTETIETGVVVVQPEIVSEKMNKTEIMTPSFSVTKLTEHLEAKILDYMTQAWGEFTEQYARQTQKHMSLEKRVEALEAQSDERLERLGSSSTKRISTIDALQTAMTEIEAEGAERKDDFRDRINALVEQITEIESVPLDADPAVNGAVPDESLKALEARLNRTESAIYDLEKGTPRDSVDGKDFTKQFEDIWETQTCLAQLQKRIVELEERQAVGEKGDPRFDRIDQRFAAFKSMLTDFERRIEVVTKAPAEQSAANEHRIDRLEMRLDGIDEAIAGWMMNTPDVATETNKLQENKEGTVQQINLADDTKKAEQREAHQKSGGDDA